MDWYFVVLKKYAEFGGRARRSEYWYFFLFNLIVTVVLSVIDGVLGTFSEAAGLGLLSGIYTLAVFLPSLGVAIRRLHDTDRSGWWILISLVPIIGIIVFLVFMCKDSDPDSNNYGPNPKTT